MFASDKTPRIGEERMFDYGRSLLYTIYRHASGLPDAEAAARARQAVSRRHGDRDVPGTAAPAHLAENLAEGLPGGLAGGLAERLARLRSPRSLALPA